MMLLLILLVGYLIFSHVAEKRRQAAIMHLLSNRYYINEGNDYE